MPYNDTFQPVEVTDDHLQSIHPGRWFAVLSSGGILRHRRNELGLTQQQVADLAHITLRQYQRLESDERDVASTSLRIGLGVCQALKLDPFRFYPYAREE